MIFRTKVTGLIRGEMTGKDGHGNPIYGPDELVPMYGELRPLTGEEKGAGNNRDIVVTRFRVFLPPTGGDQLGAFDKLTVMGLDYNVVGVPEPHHISGRVHHYEVIVERVTG